jgi:hypothetical protein
MRRRRNSPILIAGLLALLSALALIAIVWSMDGGLRPPDATARQRTVDLIVQTRLALTAEMRETLGAAATVEPTETETASP